MKHPAPALLLPLGVCGVLVCACARAPRRPNVVLLSLDTVRADHLGCYGYARLGGDPHEALSLFATRRDAAQRLQTALDQFRASRPRNEGEVPGTPLEEEDQEELRALGYVSR